MTSKPDMTVQNDEMRLYLVLKPYIQKCLALNHEINNPLAGIIGYSEFIKEDCDNLTDAQKSYLDQVILCAERIMRETEQLCREKIEMSNDLEFDTARKFFEAL